jgi:hypothetical protein
VAVEEDAMPKLLLPAVAAALAAVVAASAEPVSHAAPPPPAGLDRGVGIESAKALRTSVVQLEHQVAAMQQAAGKTASRLQP